MALLLGDVASLKQTLTKAKISDLFQFFSPADNRPFIFLQNSCLIT